MSTFGFSSLSLAIEVAIGLTAALLMCALLKAGMRVLIYRGAFAVAVLAPITLLAARFHRPVLVTIPITPARGGASPSVMDTMSAGSLPLDAAAHATVPISLVLLGIWALGAVIILVRTAIAHAALSQRHHAGAKPANTQAALADTLWRRLSGTKPVSIRFSDQAASPCVFGWLRPKMLLPNNIRETALPAVLAHELCHVRNCDTAWLIVERLACAIHWFNPLIWICAQRHREDAELVCDDAATEIVSTREYAQALVETARDSMRAPSFAAFAMSNRGLAYRVRTLISRTAPLRLPSRFARYSVAAATLMAITLLGATQLVSASELGDSATDMTSTMVRPQPGNGLIFVDAPRGARISVGDFGACWDGGHCVFEHELGSTVEINAIALTPFTWVGCNEIRGGVCEVRVTETSPHISLR